MRLLLSLSPDASIKNTLMTGAFPVRELSAHHLINSAKEARLLSSALRLALLSDSPGCPRFRFPARPGEQSEELTLLGCRALGLSSCFYFSRYERHLDKQLSHYFILLQRGMHLLKASFKQFLPLTRLFFVNSPKRTHNNATHMQNPTTKQHPAFE